MKSTSLWNSLAFWTLCGVLIASYGFDVWRGKYDSLAWIALCLFFVATGEQWFRKYMAELRSSIDLLERVNRTLRRAR